MALFDTDELLAKLKPRGMIPVAAGSWTDAAILSAISDEAETWLMPLLIKAKGEYLVKTEDLPFVQGQADYRWNSRVAAIREVSRLLADGTVVPLEELNPPQQTGLRVIPTRQGVPLFYSFKEGVLTLWPTPQTTGDSVRVKYHYRLNRLAAPADCGLISAVTPGAGSGGSTRLTVNAVSATMITNVGTVQKLDFIRGTPIFDVQGFDVAPAAAFIAGATTIDVPAATLPTGVAIGDYVSGPRRTPIPNMPPELHLCAGLRAIASIVKSKGDHTLAASLLQEAEGKEASLLTGILEPRSRGNSHRLVNRRFRR